MTTSACPGCGCRHAAGAGIHLIRAALLDGDVDRALDAGLLDAPGCEGCAEPCTAELLAARDARRGALAARTRFREREARLQRRAEARAAARTPAAPAPAAAARPALPAAAAAALARARAKATGNRTP